MAGYTELTQAQRQMLLETLSVEERMRRVLVHVQRQLSVLDAQEDIKTKVQEELGDRQREMFLREQLKAIQKELGEGDGAADIDELREKLAALDLPEEVRKEVDRELGRLGRMGREAMESQVIRTYLETIAELPWNNRSDEHLDIPAAAEILETDHYALGDVKDRVLEFLAVRQLRQAETGAPAGRGGGPAAERSETAEPTTSGQRTTRDGPPGPHREEKRQGQGPHPPLRRPSGRRQDLRGQVHRPRHGTRSTSASPSAACATRPTSAATGAPTWAPCPAASSRA